MVVTNRKTSHFIPCSAFALVCISSMATAKVLPEDRSDILYHQYDGGGVTIDGPSVLVRKAYKDKLSFWGNYYADMISGASIDVEATASPYAETRNEVSAGVDYLRNKTLMGVGFTRSEEDDYEATTVRFNISQDFFGDLSTLTFGYGYGDDTVKRNGDEVFVDAATHHSYQLEWSQILTATMVAIIGYESVVDEGFLNNPYRSVRFRDNTSGNGFSYQAELYPRTRTSDALAFRVMTYLPWRAALRGEIRQYEDSWGIGAQNVSVSYTHPLGERWEFDLRARYYTQDAADFYADIFPFRDAQNFLARDKELATFSNTSVGLGIGYLFATDGFLLFDKASINMQVDFTQFEYGDFSDVTTGATVDEEPLYQFDATVLRVFLSVWF